MPAGCLGFGLLLAFLVFLPLFLADAMLVALGKLGLGPELSLAVAAGIFLGGMVNIPLKKIPRDEVMAVPAIGLFGLGRMMPRLVRRRSYTVIAVNLGGCLVPLAVAVYELVRIASAGVGLLGWAALAVAVNTAVCWKVAKPIPRVGIAMPPLVPALAAVACALLFVPDLAPPVAFTAGVLGPLLGADLLHLGEIRKIATGTASIGGAGTFDGIVLSGLVATLLA